MFYLSGDNDSMVNLDNASEIKAVGRDMRAYMTDGSWYVLDRFNTHEEAVKQLQNLHIVLGKLCR